MTTPTRRLGAAFAVSALTLLPVRGAAAADQWIEVKSAHFTITSDAGKGATSNLAWQLEQMRAQIAVLWPWAKLDLNKPLVVFALKDEPALRALAPAYWERKNGGTGIASVWVSGYDRTFLALRTDVEQDAKRHVNPYATSYFTYFSLVLHQSVQRRLPPWLARGLSGVMSNTVIDDKNVLFGPPAPWYLRELHEGRHIPVADLVAAGDTSPLLRGDTLELFDAEAWSLVHYLMFADGGAHEEALAKYLNAILAGAAPGAAFTDTIGRPGDIQTPLRAYVDRSVFAYKALQVDATVKRESFAVAPLSAAESAARRAVFHVAMQRPVEARALIDEARKAGGAADAEVADALLLDREGKADAARDAYTRAVEAGTTDAFAHYRLATLLWRRDADRDLLTRVRALAGKSASLNPRYAAAYDFMASLDDQLQSGDPPSLALRAVSLEPADAHHRLTAARVLGNRHRYDDALKQVDAAAELADTDAVAREAADLKAWIQHQQK
jgi:hypothetical protein